MSSKLFSLEMLQGMEKRYRVQFVNSLSGFKSANLIGTCSAEGAENLAIFSSVVHLGANPALMGMVSRPSTETSVRHTLKNIQETGCFTINHVHAGIYEQAHHSSARYAEEVSEFKACGLHAEYVEGFAAPAVQEARLKIGLSLEQVIDIELNHTHFVIGAIQWVQLPEDVLAEDGKIDLQALETVAVSGLDAYHSTEQLARLPYAKPKK